jgi:hypothetical protein|tara:strand:+ start:733 stop:1083 length:351 start_codon:yes stop_codon:yes gene_type:complete
MNYIYKLIALVVAFLIFGLIGVATAGGPWSDQYCDITHETVITKNEKGEIIDQVTKEKVKCEDGVMDFLHGMKIAESCKFFTWQMPLGQKMVEQRAIACKRMDGGYEIVQGYHSIN